METFEVYDDDEDVEEKYTNTEETRAPDLNIEPLPENEALVTLGKQHEEALASNLKLNNQLTLERVKTSQLENQLALGMCLKN